MFIWGKKEICWGVGGCENLHEEKEIKCRRVDRGKLNVVELRRIQLHPVGHMHIFATYVIFKCKKSCAMEKLIQ